MKTFESRMGLNRRAALPTNPSVHEGLFTTLDNDLSQRVHAMAWSGRRCSPRMCSTLRSRVHMQKKPRLWAWQSVSPKERKVFPGGTVLS